MQPDVKHQQKVLCEVKSSPSVDDPHIAESELEQWVKMIDESDKLLRETSGVKVGIKNIPSVRGAVSTVNSNISTEPPHKITEMKSLNDLDQYVGNLGLASTSTVVGQGNIHDASSELKYNDDLTSKTPASFTDTTAPIDKVADHTGIDSTEVETFTRVQITEESDDDEEDAEDSDDGDSDDSSVGAEFNHRELALADEKLSRMYLGKDSNVPSASVVLTPSESPTAATPHINILDSVSSSKDKEPCPTKNNKDIITSDDELKTCAVALKEEGNRYKQVGDLKNALRCYTESVQLNPTLVASFNNRALVYIELKVCICICICLYMYILIHLHMCVSVHL